MSVAVEADALSKRYRIGQLHAAYGTLRESLTRSAKRLTGREHGHDTKEIWALRDVSFRVDEGEVLGVIGRNGAGKSTLLKVLTRITTPTAGRAVIRGRVGSLLEVGTGFHPELTGRENIFLNGSILGMKRRDIQRKLDEIVEFSGIPKFIDTPVKRYSSGMYVRLAFSVAAHLEPEILLVDEVLAVGDAEFQQRCLGRMEDLSGTGRTVLFVSHNMQAVNQLCDRAILLEGGALTLDGSPSDVITRYLHSSQGTGSSRSWADDDSAPGDDLVLYERSTKTETRSIWPTSVAPSESRSASACFAQACRSFRRSRSATGKATSPSTLSIRTLTGRIRHRLVTTSRRRGSQHSCSTRESLRRTSPFARCTLRSCTSTPPSMTPCRSTSTTRETAILRADASQDSSAEWFVHCSSGRPSARVS
jgi:ABC-type polysaccharide/polyol phosphate transport system ATPase subunit